MPALLINMSGNKFCSFSLAAQFLMDSRHVISSFNGIKLSEGLSNLNSLLAVPMTLYPRLARCIAIAAPIPLEAPEISTTFLSIYVIKIFFKIIRTHC